MRIAHVGPCQRFQHVALSRKTAKICLFLCALGFAAALFLSHSALVAQDLPLPHPGSWRREATLRDVAFVDAMHGWACGDRGTILRTEDGGRNWLVVASETDCRLDSIAFVDPQHGWAVGGFELPSSGRRVGVVVATLDGGRTWKRMPTSDLPWLHRVRFSDSNNGYAIGEITARQRSGMFVTRDGGKNWVALTGFSPQGWLDADTLDRASFAMVGARGGMLRFEGDRFEPAPALDGLNPRLKRVRFSRNGLGWAIGERGLVYRSHDQGRSWRSALDRNYLPGIDQVEWSALAVLDDHVWIGGFPAGIMLHSSDSGQNWNVIRTGMKGEVHAITFVDPLQGWAVGSLGKVSLTIDGGATWIAQRNPQVAHLVSVVVSDPRRVPLEMLTKIAAQEGWLTEVLVPQVGPGPYDAKASFRCGFEQWIGHTGAAETMWWNAPHQGMLAVPRTDEERAQAAVVLSQLAQQEEWKRRVVLQLRATRPPVVLLPSPHRANPLDGERRLFDLSVEAVSLAADPNAYPEQIQLLGLEPWKVTKAMAWGAREGRNGISIAPEQFALELGRTLSDFCLPARVALSPETISDPPYYHIQLLATDLPTNVASNSISAGIGALEVSAGSRRKDETPRGTYQQVQRMARIDETHAALVRLAAESEADPRGASWLAQVDRQLGDLDEWSGGNWIARLAREHERKNQLIAAARAHRLMMDRFPQHPVADHSALWLWAFYGSLERQWQQQPESRQPFLATDESGRNLAPVTFAEAQRRMGFDSESSESSEFSGTAQGNSQASFMSPSLGGINPDDVPKVRVGGAEEGVEAHLPIFIFGGQEVAATRAGASESLPFADLDPAHIGDYLRALEGWIRTERPDLAADWRFRCVGFGSPQRTNPNDWAALADYQSELQPVAAAEMWLSQPQLYPAPADLIDPPVPLETIQLDGKLDESSWQTAIADRRYAALRARDGANTAATTVVILRDEEFLYIGATCQKHPDVAYPPAPGPRLRDERPGEVDHLVLRLDPDRDHRVSYVLKIDHRGRVWDGIDQDASWDPQWFVAHVESERVWTIEAAIPLSLLQGPLTQEAWWGLGIERHCPGSIHREWGVTMSPVAVDSEIADLVSGLLHVASAADEAETETEEEAVIE